MPWNHPSCRAVSVHVTNDQQTEDVSLEVLAGYCVTFEVLISLYEFLVVVNELKSNKKS